MFQIFTQDREKCAFRVHFQIPKSLLFAALFLLVAYQGVAQNITNSGTANDEVGSILPQVNILVKGTAIGTASDARNSSFIFSNIVFDGGGCGQ